MDLSIHVKVVITHMASNSFMASLVFKNVQMDLLKSKVPFNVLIVMWDAKFVIPLFKGSACYALKGFPCMIIYAVQNVPLIYKKVLMEQCAIPDRIP